MKWTGLNELRASFLQFFESRGHLVLPSFPLIPQDDKSILLINAGMTPLKKYFSREETPPRDRVATCQKCIRTPDIENVGKTARHGTYFEMLGNFSFGDYFKKEAISWGWEFFTKVLEIPAELLWVSVYQDDDEARDIWIHEIGLPPERVVKMGKEDNFWEHGAGPCGPCTEIYFDRGEKYGCGDPACRVGCECDRYVEIWNIVFSQFDNDGKGNYTPLVNKNIDTGMGLERLACVMQGVDNIFMVDTMQKILQHASKISGVAYGASPASDISLRVITDHIRSTTFMVCDGVLPQNEGRGYVLRRLLRRAARHGRLLGITKPFLHQICETVIEENKSAYPELVEKADYIKKVIRLEEERFARTIEQGMDLLNQILDRLMAAQENILEGDLAFKLYDTFGFPIDLTREIIAEKNIKVDEEKFGELMQQQRQRAKDAVKNGGAFQKAGDLFEQLIEEATVFTGYETLCGDATIQAIVVSDEAASVAGEGEQIRLVLDSTPFYAQSGGQAADTGFITGKCGRARVLDVQRSNKGLIVHHCQVEEGSLSAGEKVQAQVDKERREAIMRNHTAAHLLQQALIDTLGTQVHQAGQSVDDKRVRFDFTHFSQMTSQELQAVEDAVNRKIFEGIHVTICDKTLQEAKQMGATALFGEKYGDVVRVVEVPGYSMELCGGTHVDNTAKLGLFKIISESSVAAGVRRIEGTTGTGVLRLLADVQLLLQGAAAAVRLANPLELMQKLDTMVQEGKRHQQEIEHLEQELADKRFSDVFSSANEVCGVQFVSAAFTGMKAEALRALGDKIKDREPLAVAVLSTICDDKATALCVCGSKAVEKGADAGKLVKAVTAITGGGGGGKKDSAMAGIKEPFLIDEAVAKLPEVLRQMLEK